MTDLITTVHWDISVTRIIDTDQDIDIINKRFAAAFPSIAKWVKDQAHNIYWSKDDVVSIPYVDIVIKDSTIRAAISWMIFDCGYVGKKKIKDFKI